jgi:hypothetical protein
MFEAIDNFMQDVTVYLGGFIGAFWGALTLFVGIRSFLLGREQNRFHDINENGESE